MSQCLRAKRPLWRVKGPLLELCDACERSSYKKACLIYGLGLECFLGSSPKAP